MDDLDAAFTLPETVADPGLRRLYEVLITRMRRECAHLPQTTLTTLLIERIAYNYIVLRWKESRPMGDAEGFAHSTAQKEYNTFWLAMTQELNKVARQTDKAFRDELVGVLSSAVFRALSDEEPEVSKRVRARVAASLENAGF
jgi:hypothetical protein